MGGAGDLQLQDFHLSSVEPYAIFVRRSCKYFRYTRPVPSQRPMPLHPYPLKIPTPDTSIFFQNCGHRFFLY